MSSVFESIQELEQKRDLNALKVLNKGKSFDIYPWVKPYIFSKLQQGNKPKTNSASKVFQLKRLFSGSFLLFKKPSSLIFSNSLERRALNDGVYDKLFHAIEESNIIGDKLLFETKIPANYFPRSSYKKKQVVSRSIFYLLEMIYATLFLRSLEIKNASLLGEFASESDISYAVRKNLAQYHITRLYLRYNKKVKNVFLSGAYLNFGQVLAFKESGAQVIELQHGVINKEHYGYSYEYIPSKNQFPDFILTFGQRDESFINQGGLSKFVRAKAVGSFILDYYLKRSAKEKLIIEVRNAAISLQDCATGVSAMDEFIDLAKRNPNIQFSLKRRRLPLSFYQEKFEFPENMSFEEELNVYELIVNSDVHITAYSSCALEAPTLGTPNILINVDNKAKEYYQEKLRASNYNWYCANGEQASSSIQSIQQVLIEQVMNQNEENIAPNYQSNLNSFLKYLKE
ncbi:MAG: hypothetical protein MK105_11315 [Crocinitomicaceae bacterium]|nr:hypothetical protein [Crocinitomicaceae bacterium]